jgi:hypothetical protein
MYRLNSPEIRAFERAREIDMDEARVEADRLASAAAYGVEFPVDREIWLTEFSRLASVGQPWDPTLWRLTNRRALIELTYPVPLIAAWFTDARVPDADRIAKTAAVPLGEICERFREEWVREGHRHQRGKSSGLGKVELRKVVRTAGQAARDLSQALRSLQWEAHRVGQAATARGRKVRQLYLTGFQVLLEELARAGRLEGDISPLIEHLLPAIDIEGDQYAGTHAPWESALYRTAQWFERAADNDRFWSAMPDTLQHFTSARDRFVQSLAALWAEMVGAAPTATDGDPPSPFIAFLHAAIGHLAGLAQARLGHIPITIELLKAQGLHPIRSARTYREILRAVGN